MSTTREIPSGGCPTNEDQGTNEINAESPTIKNDDDTASMTSLGKSETSVIGSARTAWYQTSLLLLSEVMGAGVLGLPFVAVTLGWTMTMIALPLFALFSAYSGYQLKVVKMKYPELTSFADAGHTLVGPRFGAFTKYAMLLNWGCLAVYFIIATADAIENIYAEGWFACKLNRSIIAALLIIIPAQSRDFHTISKYLSLPSTLAIIITIIIIIVTLIEGLNSSSDADGTTTFGENTIIGVKPGTSIFTVMENLSSIVFAFQGQSIFMEFMSEMKNPEQFTKTTSLSYLIMGLVYTSVVAITYGVEGENITGFLPDVVSPGAAKTTMGVLVVFHLLVSYVIVVMPFHTWLHTTIFPSTFNSSSMKGKLHWLLITCSYLTFAWIMGNLIPFFSDVQGLLGALLGAPIAFMWPSLYYLLANKKQKQNQQQETSTTIVPGTLNQKEQLSSSSEEEEEERSWKDTFKSIGIFNSSISIIFICIFTPLFVIFGTYGAMEAIVFDISISGAPFQC
jgi:amino acid permease